MRMIFLIISVYLGGYSYVLSQELKGDSTTYDNLSIEDQKLALEDLDSFQKDDFIKYSQVKAKALSRYLEDISNAEIERSKREIAAMLALDLFLDLDGCHISDTLLRCQNLSIQKLTVREYFDDISNACKNGVHLYWSSDMMDYSIYASELEVYEIITLTRIGSNSRRFESTRFIEVHFFNSRKYINGSYFSCPKIKLGNIKYFP